MFDLSHLPANANVFEVVARATIRSIWHKPPSARLILIFIIGGGGGGAGGREGGVSNNGGGGGGGGALFCGLFSASSLPNSLVIHCQGNSANPGAGGVGNGGSGGGGSNIVVSNFPRGLPPNLAPAALSVYARAIEGTGGSASSGGSGGLALTFLDMALVDHALYFTSNAGRSGTGSTSPTPANQTIGTEMPILGGAGGGGYNATPTIFDGAGFSSDLPAIVQSTVGGLASSGEQGSSGVRLPFLMVGGAGGGGHNSAFVRAGRGGHAGAIGAGGGGGGASPNTNQSGEGGDGGPGYACIIAW